MLRLTLKLRDGEETFEAKDLSTMIGTLHGRFPKWSMEQLKAWASKAENVEENTEEPKAETEQDNNNEVGGEERWTRELAKEKYTEYNKTLFNNQLPDFDSLEFKMFRQKNGAWGRGGCTSFVLRNGQYYGVRGVLELNDYYVMKRNAKDVDKYDTLVHEMVHIYEYMCEPTYVTQVKLNKGKYTKDFPSDGHGTIFYREAKRLKAYGWNITRFVTKDQDNSVDLDEKKKNNILKKGPKILIGEFKKPYVYSKKKTYKYFYAKITSVEKERDIVKYHLAKIDDYASANVYDCSNLKEFDSLKTIRSVDSFYLTNDMDWLISNYGLTESYSLMNLSDGQREIFDNLDKKEAEKKKKAQEKYNQVCLALMTHENEVIEAITSKITVKSIYDEEYDTDRIVIDDCKLKFNFDGLKFGLVMSYSDKKRDTFKGSTLYIFDDSTNFDYGGLSDSVDLAEYDPTDEHIEDLKYEIKKKINPYIFAAKKQQERSDKNENKRFINKFIVMEQKLNEVIEEVLDDFVSDEFGEEMTNSRDLPKFLPGIIIPN